MKARRTGFTTIVAASLLAALVAAIGAAQAAPATKKYDATVHVANGVVTATAATLTLTLTNDPTTKQTLGSANFTPPGGVTLGTVVGSATRPGWTASVAGGVVAFRSTSNALAKGQSVSANVSVGILQGTCGNATWTTAAKQSNDFSGTGNDFNLNPALSNLKPLGSFVWEPIGTDVSAEVFAPQILVSADTTVDVTAYDICGEAHTTYGSGFGDETTLEPFADTPPRLVGADISAIDWDTVPGSATLTPDDVVETGDKLVVADVVSGIDATSDEFDVVEKLCTSLDTTCEWENGNGKIKAEAGAPPAGGLNQPDPSLGIGFNPDLSFDCDGNAAPVGDTLININPRDYPVEATVTITLTYDNSVIGGGSADSYSFCLSKTNGASWEEPPACPSDTPVFADANCILDQFKSSGDLVVVLFLKADDPWGGLS